MLLMPFSTINSISPGIVAVDETASIGAGYDVHAFLDCKFDALDVNVHQRLRPHLDVGSG